MNISCSHCKNTFIIPEYQIYDYNTGIIVSCPECKKDIEIDLKALQQAVNASTQNLLSGEELRKVILKSVKTLPPMP